MPNEYFKNLVIGSGEGGKVLAWTLAKSGQRTAVVERRWIGGSCPNTNCLPSKNEIYSAHVAETVRRARQFGVITAPVSIDMESVRNRKREMVAGLIAMHMEKYQTSGAELIMGQARFAGPHAVEVTLNSGGTRTLTGERIFLNLGTHAAIPPVCGLSDTRPMTNIEILELDRLPEHLVIIGGGYVGLEFAQAYRRFGSRVTVIQHGPQLLADQDADIAAELARILSAEGIQIITSAEVLNAEGRSGSSVTLTLRAPSGDSTISATDILVAAGRVPNTADIGLEAAGVELDPRGYIKVNDRLRTTAANIWALGECAGSPQFTHASLDDFRVVHGDLTGGTRSTRDRLMPSCLFTDPQVAHIGLTETLAKKRGIAYRLAKAPMLAVLRTRTSDQSIGFAKALIGADDRILGFTMIGPEAGEVMAVVQIAMLSDSPYTNLRDAILAHPTMAEGLNVLFSSIAPAG
ncbi:MAG TPA: mercuric reductase [Tepidisphaeraceae bacterium]|nr:mercuric reductase [Tepidisphaeraceae bacterium]